MASPRWRDWWAASTAGPSTRRYRRSPPIQSHCVTESPPLLRGIPAVAITVRSPPGGSFPGRHRGPYSYNSAPTDSGQRSVFPAFPRGDFSRAAAAKKPAARATGRHGLPIVRSRGWRAQTPGNLCDSRAPPRRPSGHPGAKSPGGEHVTAGEPFRHRLNATRIPRAHDWGFLKSGTRSRSGNLFADQGRTAAASHRSLRIVYDVNR